MSKISGKNVWDKVKTYTIVTLIYQKYHWINKKVHNVTLYYKKKFNEAGVKVCEIRQNRIQ